MNEINEGYWKDGNTKHFIPIKNQQRHGTAKWYQENGKVHHIETCKNGKPEVIKAYQHDKLLFIHNIKNDVLNGNQYSFFKNGAIKTHEFYKNSIKTGIQKSYFNNKMLRYHENFYNNKREGIKITYFKKK